MDKFEIKVKYYIKLFQNLGTPIYASPSQATTATPLQTFPLISKYNFNFYVGLTEGERHPSNDKIQAIPCYCFIFKTERFQTPIRFPTRFPYAV